MASSRYQRSHIAHPVVCREGLRPGWPARIRPAPKIAITLMVLFLPPTAAAKETICQSEFPWVVDDG